MRAANKGAKASAESPEGGASTKGNPRDQSTLRTQGRDGVSQAVERVRQAATRKPQEKLTALMHHITTDALAVRVLRLEADGIGWRGWSGVEGVRRRTGRATARPARPRTFGSVSGAAVATGRNTQTGRRDATARHCRSGRQDRPEGGGGCHPDADLRAGHFLGFSYGFRPGRGAHDALDALAFGITAAQGQLDSRRRHPGVFRPALARTSYCGFLSTESETNGYCG